MPSWIRPLPVLAGLLGSAASASTPIPETEALPDLSSRLGTHRILVMDTPDTADAAYRIQAEYLLPHWAGLIERDLHLVTREGSPDFRIRLVGKDGGVKLDSAKPVSCDELFKLIDAMPMRRAEARRMDK